MRLLCKSGVFAVTGPLLGYGESLVACVVDYGGNL